MRYTLLMMVFALGACTSLSVRPAVPAQSLEGAQLANWRGGSATVTAQFHGDSGAAEVASGVLSAAGKLEFTLEPVETSYLTRFVSCPGVTVSDAALRLNSFSALDVVSSGVRQGRVAWVSKPSIVSQGLTRAGDYYLQYTYADRAAQIVGRCAGNPASGFSYALELARGWNLLALKLTSEGTLQFTNEPVPVTASWVFGAVAQ